MAIDIHYPRGLPNWSTPFEPDVAQVIRGLEAVRRSVCAYGPNADRCDCKYGRSDKIQGEQTGCPELRAAIDMIMAIHAAPKHDEFAIEKAVMEGFFAGYKSAVKIRGEEQR